MSKEKKSFFERLTGTVRIDEEELDDTSSHKKPAPQQHIHVAKKNTKESWQEEEQTDGQLTVDMYQTPSDIVIRTIVAGVRPDELDVSISRDMVTIKGHREETKEVAEDGYFHKELYWGSFSRTVMLPEEVEVEEAEATEKHGLLTIRLPKINKQKQAKIKVKSVDSKY